ACCRCSCASWAPRSSAFFPAGPNDHFDALRLAVSAVGAFAPVGHMSSHLLRVCLDHLRRQMWWQCQGGKLFEGLSGARYLGWSVDDLTASPAVSVCDLWLVRQTHDSERPTERLVQTCSEGKDLDGHARVVIYERVELLAHHGCVADVTTQHGFIDDSVQSRWGLSAEDLLTS